MIGQELLQAGQYHSAVTVLESALRIGTCSLKLRGSVFSALSSAYWALNQLDKAIGYMQQDLAVAKSLGDSSGECRGNKTKNIIQFYSNFINNPPNLFSKPMEILDPRTLAKGLIRVRVFKSNDKFRIN